MTLPIAEFIRRFLLHVLPKGFHKVRYYGIWHTSNSNHVSTLAAPMTIAAMMSKRTPAKPEDEDQMTPDKTLKCPHASKNHYSLQLFVVFINAFNKIFYRM